MTLENIQVEGYNPQKVSLGEKKTISQDELCEYCGERRRGTEKNPDKLRQVYEIGRQVAESRMGEVRQFFREEKNQGGNP